MKISEKEKSIQDVYKKKHGIRYEDALFRTQIVCRMLGKDKPFKRILDGAGFFPTAHVLAENYPKAKVTILNLWKENDILHEYYDNIDHIQGDLTKMAFPDDSFDLVFLGEVIEHIYDLPEAIKEVKRILKPGGYLALTTPNLASWFNRILLLFGKCPITYHPAPIMYNRSLLKRFRKTYGRACEREFPIHHFHIRVFTLFRLLDYLKLKDFAVEDYKIYNCSSPDRRLAFLRRMLGFILPEGAKENIAIVARNQKKAGS
jgi:SAM-dependent methyltransferase